MPDSQQSAETESPKRRQPRRRRRPPSDYYVVNLPPPWSRSLTESGMRRKPTRFDALVVAGFAVAMLMMAIWLVIARL